MRLRPAALLVAVMIVSCTSVTSIMSPDNDGHPQNERISRSPQTIAHTLRIGDVSEVTSLNPHLDITTTLGNLSQMTMAYLVRYDHANRPTPELATIVPSQNNGLISKDGRTITWRLRRGVRWSDGQPFDGDDVVFSTNAVNNLKNNETSRDGFDLISKIDEPDRFTVVFHLRRPYVSFLSTFFGSAGANPCILPNHLLGKLADINHAEYNSKPIGIGPFRYIRWNRGDDVELEANPYYWRGAPKLKHIIYRFIPDSNTLLTQLRTGEIDLWPYVRVGFIDRLRSINQVKTVHAPGYYYSHLDFNESHALLQDLAVRQALRYAIDRATIRNKVMHGLGILQENPLTPVSALYTAEAKIPFDPARANAILGRAGWIRGANGVRVKHGRPLSFDFAAQSGLSDSDQMIELIRGNLAQIGATIEVRHYPSALMFADFAQGGIIESGKFDLTTFAWQLGPEGDLSANYSCNQIPPNGENDVHYCNALTDGYLKRGQQIYAEAIRKPLIAAAEKQIIADVPEVVLWIREDIFSYNRDLRGWRPNAVTPFDDMLGVDI